MPFNLEIMLLIKFSQIIFHFENAYFLLILYFALFLLFTFFQLSIRTLGHT
ncbi:hypothetical protein Sjap_013669 [Stephania japonica]|uniref:Uncharacterized protein n=1 Tax=Stephania japonica TaxID=461633 RepID=A0AAP0J0B8_9MAGN